MRDFSWFRGGKRRISYEPKLGLLIDEEEESDSEDKDVCQQGGKMVPMMRQSMSFQRLLLPL